MLRFSICVILLSLVNCEIHFHKHWDDHLNYEDEKMTAKLEDISDQPMVFLSNSLPAQKYMPTVGNGKVATVVSSDTVFVDGVYSGELGESHRARFQNFVNVRLEFPESGIPKNKSYSVDVQRGVYIEKTYLENHDVEHRIFAHKSYRSLLVSQIFVRELTEGAGPLRVNILTNPGTPSSDMSPMEGTSQINRTDVEQLLGVTNIIEDPRYQSDKIKVFQVWNKIENTISVLGTKTHLMALDGNERGDFTNSVDDFLFAMDLIDSGKDELLFDIHVTEWAKIWDSGRIEIEGNNLELAKAITGAQYYILSSLPTLRDGQKRDRFWGLSPGGLGNGALFADYQGHSFWDTETWMFPAILLLWQDVAKDLLLYRQATIQPARDRAASNNYKGARFSWESAYTGTEVTPDCCPETRENQQHITGDIAFAARQYFAMSGDTAWLTGDEEYNFNVSANGCQFIREMAEFWASRVELEETSGSYVINGVMPPDEDAYFVNNSIYTNTIAAYSIHFADYISCVCEETMEPIPEEWLNIARNLKYFYDEELQYHPEYDGYQIGSTIKQADVVLLGFPLMRVNDAIKRQRDLDVYENVTRATGPAMTWSMHTIGHLELGNIEKAEEMFNRSYQPYKMEPFKIWNEAQNQEGATNFITGMGGFLQSIMFGYFGIRLKVNHISMNPILPLETTSIRIKGLDYHGCAIDAMANATAIYLTISGNCSLLITQDGVDSIAVPGPQWEGTFRRDYLQISPTMQPNCKMPEDTLGGVRSVAAAEDIGLVLLYSTAALVIKTAQSLF